jgi:CelD/BcsL family acetyltransferase involved in cellulose biosynthesis
METSADQCACPTLGITDSETGLRDIPADQRRKLRRAWRLCQKRGGAEVVRVDGDTRPFLRALLDLHGARWRSRGERGVLIDKAIRRFHTDALPRLAAAGLARLYLLTIAGKVAGAYYGLMHRDRAYAYLGGFDPDFAYESPGMILIGHAITEAAREGAGQFDFLRGREAYKYRWGARDLWNRRRSFCRRAAS